MKNKTSEVQSKLTNAVLVDVNKNQVSTFYQNFGHRIMLSVINLLQYKYFLLHHYFNTTGQGPNNTSVAKTKGVILIIKTVSRRTSRRELFREKEASA